MAAQYNAFKYFRAYLPFGTRKSITTYPRFIVLLYEHIKDTGLNL